MSDLHPDHVTPVLALEDQDACSPLVLRSAGLQAAKIIRKLTNDLGYREQEITRLRADLTQLERESDAEISALRACLAQAEADLAAAQRERDEARELLSLFTQQANKESALKRASEAERALAAAQEREQRMREALEAARGLYQVTHIHAAIDAALGEPR